MQLQWVKLVVCYESVDVVAGRDKDAWPELLHEDWEVAKAALESSGFVQNVYVQHPGGSRPANIGSPADIWLYTDGSTTYEIPRRGVWHPNRNSPLSPNLVVGSDFVAVVRIVQAQHTRSALNQWHLCINQGIITSVGSCHPCTQNQVNPSCGPRSDQH